MPYEQPPTADTSQPAPDTPSPTARHRPRIAALDVLRGFALCGILLVNIPIIAYTGGSVAPPDPVAPSGPDGGHDWMGTFVVHRFFPIFSVLFGVGFTLLLDSVADRVARPRLLLLRRLLALLAIGAAHMLLWPGDILTIYAVVGLVVLLPATWLPRWAVAGLAAALILATLLTADGGIPLVPGLFLLGVALVRYDVVARIERSARGPALLGLLLAGGAALALWTHARLEVPAGELPEIGLRFPSAAAGLLLAGVYVCVLLVLLHTPLRPVLRTLFVPLGRMALTNYLATTLLVLASSRFLGLPSDDSPAQVLPVAGVVLVLLWIFSTLWLRRYRHGPLEWAWRWVTWGRRPPLRAT